MFLQGGWRALRAGGALALMAGAGLGCASVIEGRSQHISVNTNPPGASCGLYREQGMRIGLIESTPGEALIEKTKADIWVVCVKPGYQEGRYLDRSGVAGAAFANVVGGVFTLGIATVVGVAVDASNGSSHIYESPVNLTLAPDAAGQPPGPSSLPRTYDPAHMALRDLEPAAVSTPSSEPDASIPRSSATPQRATSITSGTPSTPFGAGTWMCLIENFGNSNNPRFQLQITVGVDNSIVVVSYDNAPATITQREPLIFTAINPRGSRLTQFYWKPNNVLAITGPSLNEPSRPFYNEGACTKIS